MATSPMHMPRASKNWPQSSRRSMPAYRTRRRSMLIPYSAVTTTRDQNAADRVYNNVTSDTLPGERVSLQEWKVTMNTSNTPAKHMRSTVSKIVMALTFAAVIGAISLVPALGQDNNRRQGYQDSNRQQYQGYEERGWQQRQWRQRQ